MTTFDDKEKATENKYAYDKEMEFKVHVRAHKLLGLWAAGRIGLSGAKAEEYAQSLVTDDLAKADRHRLFEKIKTHLFAHDVHVTDRDIHAEMYKAEQKAKEQLGE